MPVDLRSAADVLMLCQQDLVGRREALLTMGQWVRSGASEANW